MKVFKQSIDDSIFKKKALMNELINYSDASVISRTLIKKESGTVTLFSFDKGQALSEHTSPFDAMVFIIKGNVEIVIDGESYFLTEGETILMPANVPHAVYADDRFKMLLIMIKS